MSNEQFNFRNFRLLMRPNELTGLIIIVTEHYK